MRKRIKEALISVTALVILVAALVALDPRLRDYAKSAVMRKDTIAADVSRMKADAHDNMTTLRWLAAEKGLDSAALAVFIVVATGLVAGMLRL